MARDGESVGGPAAVKDMRTALLIVGVLLALAGLVWVAQGAGWFRYPSHSFMIDQTRWVYYGLVAAAAGAVVVWLSRLM